MRVLKSGVGQYSRSLEQEGAFTSITPKRQLHSDGVVSLADCSSMRLAAIGTKHHITKNIYKHHNTKIHHSPLLSASRALHAACYAAAGVVGYFAHNQMGLPDRS
jgi:hypothetical protein